MGGSGDGAAHRPPANSRAEAMRAARLRLGQFAFSRDALMVFVCTLDAIFELAAVVSELFGDFVGPARHIATERRLDHHGLTDMKFVGGHWENPCPHALRSQSRDPP